MTSLVGKINLQIFYQVTIGYTDILFCSDAFERIVVLYCAVTISPKAVITAGIGVLLYS